MSHVQSSHPSLIVCIIHIAFGIPSTADHVVDHQDDDNSLDGIGDFGVPFNQEDTNIHVGAIELNGTFDRRSMDEKVFYTKMESKLRSLAKLCETVPGERQTVLDQMTALEGSLTKKALAKRGLNAPVGTLISSNPPIESSPQKKRIKGSHE